MTTTNNDLEQKILDFLEETDPSATANDETARDLAIHLVSLGYPTTPEDTIIVSPDAIELDDAVAVTARDLMETDEHLVNYGLAMEIRNSMAATRILVVGDVGSPIHLAGILAKAVQEVSK